jgi:hypothetical protein
MAGGAVVDALAGPAATAPAMQATATNETNFFFILI